MAEPKKNQRCAMARRLWMVYFNRILLEEGLLTKKEYLHMEQMIRQKYPNPTASGYNGTA